MMRVPRSQLAAKVEVTEGTAETLAGADVLIAHNISWRPEIVQTERPNVAASLSQWARVPGERKGTLEFETELKGSGAAGTAPAIGRLLRACGFGETVVPSTSVTYAPASTSIPSITLGGFFDGVAAYRLWGARGNARIVLEAGKPGIVRFSFTGADFSVLDAALFTTGVTLEATVPPPFLSASLTVQAYAALVGRAEIDIGNSLALRKDANAGSGNRSCVITNRATTMSIDPEFVSVATADFFGLLRSGTQGALNIGPLGATAGNRITITAPRLQYISAAPGDREGVRTLGLDCALNRNAGDDEISIVFT